MKDSIIDAKFMHHFMATPMDSSTCRVQFVKGEMPLPGMSLPGLLCVPGMKESKSQYKLEGRDVVYLCVRPGADFGTTAFAAKCLAEVRAVLPSSEPVDAIGARRPHHPHRPHCPHRPHRSHRPHACTVAMAPMATNSPSTSRANTMA